METVVLARNVVRGDWMVVAGVGLRVLESTRVLERQCISFHAPDGEPRPILYMPRYTLVAVERAASPMEVLDALGYNGTSIIEVLENAGFTVSK